MKPAPFEYVLPDSLPEALSALREHGFDAKLLAGGQSLVPVMNFRLNQPGVLIDLNRLEELNFIREDAASGEIRLGGMVRQRQLERDALIAERLPLLHETMPYIAHPQIRNRGTLGGSLVHADPAAELPVIAVALNGRFRLQNATADRWVNAQDFYVSLFETACADDEILVEVALPPLPPRTGYAFLEMSRRHGDFALAGVAVTITMNEQNVCTGAKLVYLNVGEGPVDATGAAQMLVGESITDGLIGETAVYAAQNEVEPEGDIHATAAYKRHLVKVLTVRTIEQAVKRVG
ncbi:MAG: xanthine dehydrogenase family protein subunit M [Chloroflexi bacterium]|nr:xanthine dehydrogenase family protein subunit M [Chloroflexota bacterium]